MDTKFAVLRIAGKQYKAVEGKEILVDRLFDPKKVEPEVLLIADGDSVEIGSPVLTKAKITLKVINEVEKGEKVDVFKYKSKSRERRHVGFRPQYTRILVTDIKN